MVIVNLPVHVHVDVHVYVDDGERAIRSEERVSRQKLASQLCEAVIALSLEERSQKPESRSQDSAG